MPDKYEPLPAGTNPLRRFWTEQPQVQPSAPDERDHVRPFPLAATGQPRTLPARAAVPPLPVGTQQRGDCMIWSGIRVLRNALRKVGIEADLSESFLSALYLEATNQIGQDVGSPPREVMALCKDVGALLESDLPYTPRTDLIPTADQKALAAGIRALEYVKCLSLDDVKAAIAAGDIVVVCHTLYWNYQPDAEGRIPLPDPRRGIWGPHAETLRAYDDDLQEFADTITEPGRVRGGETNQWGYGWGIEGEARLPYAFFDLPMWNDPRGDGGGVWRGQDGDLWTIAAVAAPRLAQPTPTPEPEPVPVPVDYGAAYRDGVAAARAAAQRVIDETARLYAQRSQESAGDEWLAGMYEFGRSVAEFDRDSVAWAEVPEVSHA